MTKIRPLITIAVGALLAAHTGCSTSGKTSGETHWLEECGENADCGGSAQCLCGVCTRTCAGDGDCGDPGTAQCFATASPGLSSRCEGLPPSDGICLAVCSEASPCPRGSTCLLGACVRGPSSDGGTSSGQLAGKYVNVDAGVGFGEEVITPPAPSPLLDGIDDELLGHWAEFGADGERCTPEHNTATGAAACMQLEVAKDAASGSYFGTVYFLLSASAPPSPVNGPFAPATDGHRGYPTEIAASDYRVLQLNPFPNGRYTAFDGHFDGSTFSFWTSNAELWDEWCRLQEPHPFDARLVSETRRQSFRCVPQGAAPGNTDIARLVLCTVFMDYPRTDTELDCDPAPNGGASPLCWQGSAVCNCDARGCFANLRGASKQFRLSVSGSTMRSNSPIQPLELRKVSP